MHGLNRSLRESAGRHFKTTTCGSVAEWLIASVLKTDGLRMLREFKSHRFLHCHK